MIFWFQLQSQPNLPPQIMEQPAGFRALNLASKTRQKYPPAAARATAQLAFKPTIGRLILNRPVRLALALLCWMPALGDGLNSGSTDPQHASYSTLRKSPGKQSLDLPNHCTF